MAIVSFTFNCEYIQDFIQFGYDHYREDEKWIPPQKKSMKAQFAPEFFFYKTAGNEHQHFLARTQGRVVGRVSAFINRDLKDENAKPVATIGFYECIDDSVVSEELLGTATQWIYEKQGIDCIWGPMNFDIWHEYRLMTRGFDENIFIGEPYNKSYYADQFQRFGFYVKQHWHSVELQGYDMLNQMALPSAQRYKQLLEQGYRFEFFNIKKYNTDLLQLYSILTQSFSGFLGYTPISFEQFAQIFSLYRYAFHPRLFTLVYDQNNILSGFAGAFLDISNAVRDMRGNDNLVAKFKFLCTRRRSERVIFYIGGITPQEAAKQSGLGRAGFYHLIHQILGAGYDKVVIAIMASGNRVRGLLSGNAQMAQRQYTLYELKRQNKGIEESE